MTFSYNHLITKTAKRPPTLLHYLKHPSLKIFIILNWSSWKHVKTIILSDQS
nr:unnamed protein product [Meloidogyne enterolobii]